MAEIWKDIKDYKGLYQVSNYGVLISTMLIMELVLKDEVKIILKK